MSFIHETNNEYKTNKVPYSFQSCDSEPALKSRLSHNVISCQSSSVGQGGSVIFQINTANCSIKRESMMLSFHATFTGGNVGLTSFQGPDYVGSAHNFFQKITANTGNGLLDQFNYSSNYMQVETAHSLNKSYITNDLQITQGNGLILGAASSNDFLIPVPLGVFNSQVQDYPLYMMTSPISLQFDTNSINQVVYDASGAVNAPSTDFVLSKLQLIYTAIIPDDSNYFNAERSASIQHPFKMPVILKKSYLVTNATLSSLNIGIGCSSVRQILVVPLNASSYSTAVQTKFLRTVDAESTNTLFIGDGINLNQGLLDTLPKVYNLLKQAIFQSPVTQSMNPTLCSNMDAFKNQYFTIGCDCTNFSDQSTVNAGRFIGNLNIIQNNYTSNTNMCYVWIVYDATVEIYGNGDVKVTY